MVAESSPESSNSDEPPPRKLSKLEEFEKRKKEAEEKQAEGLSELEIKLENHCQGVSTPLENKTHMLLYKQRVMAVVTETRNENNYIQFDFFKLPNKDYKSLSQRRNLQ